MILLTGSSGFLGRAMIRRFLDTYRERKARGVIEQDKWTYMGYDLPQYTILPDDPWTPQAKYNIADWLKEMEVCFHIAAVADLNDSAKDPGKTWRVNVEGTLNVAQECAKAGRLMIYISTCCAYGSAGADGKRLVEYGPVYPTEQYAWSKLIGEQVLAHVPGLRYRIARIGTLYGPGMRPALFNRIALERCAKGQAITVHGTGDQTRTYLYIDDCTAGLVAIWERGQDFMVYNVAGEDETSVMDSINIAGKVTGRAPMILQGADREGQIMREIVDTSKLRATGWRPETRFEDGMRKTWAWMQEQSNAHR